MGFFLSLLRLLIISLKIQQISWIMDVHSLSLFCFIWQIRSDALFEDGIVVVLHCKRMKTRHDFYNLITFLLNLNIIDLKFSHFAFLELSSIEDEMGRK